MTITAIETRYAGYAFRSRLEARWAVFFDKLGIPWKYEPQGYVVAGQPYLPDFWVGDEDGCWVEVKGTLDREGLAKIAAAAGPDGLPLHTGNDARPIDIEAQMGGPNVWLQTANPLFQRILLLGDIPDPRIPWAHPLLLLSNGRHLIEMPATWWSVKGKWRLLRLDGWSAVGADPTNHMPHGSPYPALAANYLVSDAYAAARSARFEHGESGAR